MQDSPGWKDAVVGFKCLTGTVLAFSLRGLAAVMQYTRPWNCKQLNLERKRDKSILSSVLLIHAITANFCHSVIHVFITVTVKKKKSCSVNFDQKYSSVLKWHLSWTCTFLDITVAQEVNKKKSFMLFICSLFSWSYSWSMELLEFLVFLRIWNEDTETGVYKPCSSGQWIQLWRKSCADETLLKWVCADAVITWIKCILWKSCDEWRKFLDQSNNQ